MTNAISPQDLREIILNTTRPVVMRKFQTNWRCFNETLSEWCTNYDLSLKNSNQDPQEFERISTKLTTEPQWERKRERLPLTAEEFLRVHSKQQEFWTGLNYKRAHELPIECSADIDFSCFGFEQHNRDYTFWLSSAGANTPCHYDTYGCNIVVQVHGRKSWLLLHPKTPLTTTRIPYEESSVYCLENFYAPAPHQLAALKKLQPYAYHAVLEPQDVLIVPHHWWHFVESLETSLSVNHWVPLSCDLDFCLDEIIVKYIIERFVKEENENVQKYILNPNQFAELTDQIDVFQLFEDAMDLALGAAGEEPLKMAGRKYWPYATKPEAGIDSLLTRFPNAEPVKCMTHQHFHRFLTQNSKRFNSSSSEKSPLNNVQELLINSICTPIVIAQIKQEFFRRKYANRPKEDES